MEELFKLASNALGPLNALILVLNLIGFGAIIRHLRAISNEVAALNLSNSNQKLELTQMAATVVEIKKDITRLEHNAQEMGEVQGKVKLMENVFTQFVTNRSN